MAKGHYIVDYHLIWVVYFSNSVPSPESLAQVWGLLGELGSLPVEMSIFGRGDKKTKNFNKSVLGCPGLSEAIINKGEALLSTGASSFRSDAKNAILDSDVNFIYNRNGVWDGEQGPPTLEISFSSQLIEQVGIKTVKDMLSNFFDIADTFFPICGLIDLARPHDAFAGMIFGAIWPRTAPLNRWIEQIAWFNSASKRGDRLRGVYWGNYLGPRILERLGGKEQFAELCRKKARNYDESSNADVRAFANGVFVSLCLDPLGCRPGASIGIHPAAEANLKWLIRELGNQGVLNQW